MHKYAYINEVATAGPTLRMCNNNDFECRAKERKRKAEDETAKSKSRTGVEGGTHTKRLNGEKASYNNNNSTRLCSTQLTK